ncbi:hypothetical protein GAU81_23185 [Salmonella enterica]|uniref:Phage tail protein n=1 Tax=Salmonella enterica TaxID=28901 RepID=A0A627XVP3_SALER|nr:hypothetical protein [Salmonella enterica]
MMKTFHWKVDPDMGVDSEPQVSVVRFGDGYEQRRASGINNDLKKYSVKGILLCAGNKTGDEKRFYEVMIPIADREFAAHLDKLKKE